MIDCSRAKGSIDAQIDGELESVEEGLLQAHLSACPSCHRELESRRLLSAVIGDEIRQSVKGGRSTLADRAAVMAALHRPSPWIRSVAALVMVGVVGILGFTLLGKRTVEAKSLAKETAELILEREAADARYKKLLEEIERMTEEIRAQLPPEGESTSADRTAEMELISLEDRVYPIPPSQDLPTDPQSCVNKLVQDLGSKKTSTRVAARRYLRDLGSDALPYVEAALSRGAQWYLFQVAEGIRGANENKVEVNQTLGDRTLEFRQFGNGKVELLVLKAGMPQKFQARNMRDLQKQHRSVCQQLGIGGSDGWVTIGGIPAGMDLEGRLTLLFCSMEETDFAPVRREAFEKVLKKADRGEEEVQTRIASLETRCRKAEERKQIQWGLDPNALAHMIESLNKLGEAELLEVRSQNRRELQEVRGRIETCSQVRGKLEGLNLYVREVHLLAK